MMKKNLFDYDMKLCTSVKLKVEQNVKLVLTLSVQKSHMSFPPTNMVITFQSSLKSMRCEGENKQSSLHLASMSTKQTLRPHDSISAWDSLTESFFILSTRTRTCRTISLKIDMNYVGNLCLHPRFFSSLPRFCYCSIY